MLLEVFPSLKSQVYNTSKPEVPVLVAVNVIGISIHLERSDENKETDAKRLEVALNRIKKIREWETEYGLGDIDPFETIEKFDTNTPDYYINHYVKNREKGFIIVTHALTKSKHIFKSKKNLARWFVAETWRMDLTATDLEKARRGVAILIPWSEDGFKI